MEATLTVPQPARTIVVRPDLYDTLLRIAARDGKNVNTLADEILTFTARYDAPAVSLANTGETLMEIIAPLQQDFEASGMSDDELADFIADEIAAPRKEQGSVGG